MTQTEPRISDPRPASNASDQDEYETDNHEDDERRVDGEDQIGGQIDAGFVVTGFYEDRYPEKENDPLSKVMPRFIATRATKSQS